MWRSMNSQERQDMLNKRVHWLQHVSFEGLGYFSSIFEALSFNVTVTKLYEGESLPETRDIDMLVVMGGPMNIYDIVTYPWLIEEKRFIAAVIAENKPVLGVCLGAQLIADVLGAQITPNPHKEIGWWDVQTYHNIDERLSHVFPLSFKTFHWHGDTFALPEGAVNLQYSQGCTNQSFIYKDNVIGLQYHIEMLPETIDALCLHCHDELEDQPYIQTAQQMQSHLPLENHLIASKLITYLLEV